MHPQHQCLKLRLRGIRAFSTHLEPGGALASASCGNLLEFQCGDGNCPSRFRTPAGQAGQLRKNGAVGLSVRRSESVLLRNDFYATQIDPWLTLVQPQGFAGFRNRSASSLLMKMQLLT